MNQLNFKKHIFSLVCVAFFIIIAIGSADDTTEKSGTDSSTPVETSEKPQTPVEISVQLKQEISSFDKPFDHSNYNGSIENVQMELILFSLWTNVINKGENSDDESNQKLASQLKKKVVTLQLKEFPRMRKAYGEIAAKNLWENDVYVTVQGETNGIINLSGGFFATNKNIQSTENTLEKVLTEFRFKEARYRWYKGADEFTFYKIESPKDSELVSFND